MQPTKGIIDSMQTNTTISLSDEVCTHTTMSEGKEITKHHPKVILPNGFVGCPICFCKEDTKRIIEEKGFYTDQTEKRRKEAYLEKNSMIADITVKKARLENYEIKNDEMAANKNKALNYIEFVASGGVANLFIQGKPGVGKSHLAYSICFALNDGNRKVTFVSISELVRRIKETFRKDKTDSEHAIITRLTDADILVLDDLGAEVGNIDNHSTASDFISRVIFAVLDGRQGKCTIFTTNLTGTKLKQVYDMRTVSRMFSNFKHITFKETKDYRKVEIPF